MLSMVGFTGGCGIGSNVARGDFVVIAPAPFLGMEIEKQSSKKRIVERRNATIIIGYTF